MTQVIKVTSKGQVTIPSSIRAKLGIEKDSYIAVDTIGDFIVMKKVALQLTEISNILGKEAKEKGITKKQIDKAILEAREEVWG